MNKVLFIRKIIIIACQNFFFTTKVVNKYKHHRLLFALRYSAAGFIFFLLSCTGGLNSGLRETPTSGDIKISVDESFRSLLETEIYTFTHLYTNAQITAEYKPEYDVISDFMNDSVKLIVTSKKLTDDQVKYLRDSLIIPRTTTYAYDALALVTNKANNDTLLPFNTVRDIFEGKIKNWKEINQDSELEDIRVIFDNNKSGNIRYFRERFDIEGSLPDNFYALNDNPEVIDFVSRNPDALGIISVNWISDKDDSLSMSFVNKINVIAVSKPYLDDGTYTRPLPGHIYDRSYPFVREVYFISRETFHGLGYGFMGWACGEQGQRIVLKAGLVPATMPIRLVHIRNE